MKDTLPGSVIGAGTLVLDRVRQDRRAKRRIARRLAEGCGNVVQSGPFSGMTLTSARASGSLAAFLLGSYESELHEALEELIDHRPSNVINVGAAEGYYAVGMARRLPHSTIWAFDLDKQAQRLIHRTARLNGVSDRVRIGGECTSAIIGRVATPGCLLIVDVDGFELDLLQPDAVPALRTSSLLVELHDFVDPTLSATVEGRFAATHDCQHIAIQPRDSNDYPPLRHFAAADQVLALSEGRLTPQSWAVLVPR